MKLRILALLLTLSMLLCSSLTACHVDQENHIGTDTETSTETDTEVETPTDTETETEPQPTVDELLVKEAYELAPGATLGTQTLTGKVTKINTPYSAQHDNVTLTIVVGTLTDMPVECYRLTGADAATVAVGDVITVTGELMNYARESKVEFNTGATFVTVGGTTDGDATDTETETQSGTDIEIETRPAGEMPPVDEAARDAFYGDSDPADSHAEAVERSKQGIISGALTVPDQAPTVSLYQPQIDGELIRNNTPYFADENTYVVVNANGYEVFRVYRGGGYITLEEIAAYLYAFGDVPANYTSSKKTSPSSSIWGEYLRVNHTKFSGSTTKYPYEPKLPRISGCGGDLQYYEIDIGTTGTTAGEGYEVATYNNGYRIVRGAARIVYSRFDRNGNKIIEDDEKYIFYTYNHYNDFQEYLNYYGGWGEMFGNITGGGTLSSKSDYNPTAYVETVRAPLSDGRMGDLVAVVWMPAFLREEQYAWEPTVA